MSSGPHPFCWWFMPTDAQQQTAFTTDVWRHFFGHRGGLKRSTASKQVNNVQCCAAMFLISLNHLITLPIWDDGTTSFLTFVCWEISGLLFITCWPRPNLACEQLSISRIPLKRNHGDIICNQLNCFLSKDRCFLVFHNISSCLLPL